MVTVAVSMTSLLGGEFVVIFPIGNITWFFKRFFAEFILQCVHQISNRYNFLCPVSIGAAKCETIAQIPELCIDEC
jgi:hypothetical protein